MADPFVSTVETYERVVKDDRDGTEWHVVYRPLSAGDRAVMQDLARMSMGGEEDEGEGAVAEMRIGAAQVITLDRAIVSWDLPLAKTRQTIEQLQPAIFDGMYAHVSWGSLPEDSELEAAHTPDPLPSSNSDGVTGDDDENESAFSSDRPETSPTED